jgi:hypothetical protein
MTFLKTCICLVINAILFKYFESEDVDPAKMDSQLQLFILSALDPKRRVGKLQPVGQIFPVSHY